jgi:hypothetical protein
MSKYRYWDEGLYLEQSDIDTDMYNLISIKKGGYSNRAILVTTIHEDCLEMIGLSDAVIDLVMGDYGERKPKVIKVDMVFKGVK